jgi:hypothetical protein
VKYFDVTPAYDFGVLERDRCCHRVEFTVKDEREATREVCAGHREWAVTSLKHQGGRKFVTRPQDAITSGCQAPKDAP